MLKLKITKAYNIQTAHKFRIKKPDNTLTNFTQELQIVHAGWLLGFQHLDIK